MLTVRRCQRTSHDQQIYRDHAWPDIRPQKQGVSLCNFTLGYCLHFSPTFVKAYFERSALWYWFPAWNKLLFMLSLKLQGQPRLMYYLLASSIVITLPPNHTLASNYETIPDLLHIYRVIAFLKKSAKILTSSPLFNRSGYRGSVFQCTYPRRVYQSTLHIAGGLSAHVSHSARFTGQSS